MDVEEELEPGTRLGEVTAIDEDIGENAAINYAIICEYNNVFFLIFYFFTPGIMRSWSSIRT